MIREVCEKDLLPVLELYMYLHEDNIPAENEHLRSASTQIGRASCRERV